MQWSIEMLGDGMRWRFKIVFISNKRVKSVYKKQKNNNYEDH